MKPLRQFLIKYLFGRYWYRFPGQQHYNNTSRGPFWFFNGYLLIAILWMLTGFGLGLSIPWSIIVLYFGFPLKGLGYFQMFPVKWHELDPEQKWMYGQAHFSNDLSKPLPWNEGINKEWRKLNQEFKIKYRLIP